MENNLKEQVIALKANNDALLKSQRIIEEYNNSLKLEVSRLEIEKNKLQEEVNILKKDWDNLAFLIEDKVKKIDTETKEKLKNFFNDLFREMKDEEKL